MYKYVYSIMIIGLLLPGLGNCAGEAGEFLQYGVGVRALSMGRAYVAGVMDSTAMYSNPANLALIERSGLDAMYASLYEGYLYTYLSGAYPTISGDNFGADFIMIKSPSITRRLDDGSAQGSWDDSKMSMGVGYGRQILPRLYVGGVIRGIYRSLAGDSDIYGNMNAGASYKVNEEIQCGLVMNNLMSLEFSGASADQFDLNWRAGMTYTMLNKSLIMGFDLFPNGKKYSYGIGMEYTYMDKIKARIGTNPEEFTMGAGLLHENYKFDVGYVLHNELEGLFRFSFGIDIGESVSTIKKNNSAIFFEEGKKYYKNGRYSDAVGSINKALELDQDNNVKQRYLSKLKALVKEFDEIEDFEKYTQRTGKEQRLVSKLIEDYIEGNITDARDEVIYAQFMMPQDKKVQKIAGLMKQENPNESIEGKDIFSNYLEDALTYYRDKKYLSVVAMCRRALNLDPNSVTAYSRIGSAYFKLGQPEEARRLWEIALEIDPGNQNLVDALNSLN